MAGKWNDFEEEFLKLIFQNVNPSNYLIGALNHVRGSATAGNLYIALFTADPTETGSIANECNYTNYARKAVARSSAGWTVTSNVVTNTAAITFVTAGSSETATHYGICKAGTRAVADLIMYGEFTSPLSISNGVTPQIPAGSLSITEE